ncbi:MAG: hypothetical protein LBQ62_06960 [Candidatus Accumulibacter sp.]|nr:hypothetical protein [Accumulibacter sp.]
MSDFPSILRHGRHLLPALLAAALSLPALAQSDPPGRIGRIAWTSGEVYLNSPDSGELVAAPLNQPLTSGDVVATGSGARAEIQIGAMTLRLDTDSRIAFDHIDDAQVRVVLNSGRIIAKLPTEEIQRDFALDAGRGLFLPRATGVYRFDRHENDVVATVYFGTLRYEGENMAFDVNAGESAHLQYDDAGRFGYRMAQGVRDEFTQWSAARDQPPPLDSPRHVSPEMTGAQDLDVYGDWSETPDYGVVWFPRALAADWAPYRNGHWTWVSPWGWTWIAREPWGFAPFHYGRWARLRGAWAWVPGTRMRPVYAPALVGWVGRPGGVSLGVGSAPPVGWFPLAPRERYVPFYRASPSHARIVNAPHFPRAGNVGRTSAHSRNAIGDRPFTYRHESSALSVAPADAFGHRRSGVRITPRAGDERDFRGRAEHAVPPAGTAPRRVGDGAGDRDRPQRPDSPRPRMDEPAQRAQPGPAGGTTVRRDRAESIAPRAGFTVPRRDSAPRPEFRRERHENPTHRTLVPASVQPAGPAMQGPATSRLAPSAQRPDSSRPRMNGPAQRTQPGPAGGTTVRRDRTENVAPRAGFTAPRRDSAPRPEFRRERRENPSPRMLVPASVQPPRPAMQGPAKSRLASSSARERERPREFNRSQEQRPKTQGASQRTERRAHGRR